MPYKDKNKQKIAQHRSYLRNKDKYLEQQKVNRDEINTSNRLRRQDKIAKIVEIKEATPCADCTQNYPYYVMDFDHVRGSKIGTVSDLVAAGCSWRMIQEEIDKCDIICSNCHRERTHERNQWYNETNSQYLV